MTILALAALLWFILRKPQQPNAPLPQESPSPRPSVVLLDTGKRPSYSEARLTKSERYDFSALEKQLRSDRLALAACFLKAPEFSAPRIQLSLSWEPQGTLRQMKLTPHPSEATEECISGIVRRWKMRPHPGMQPFSYRVYLVPGTF